MTYTPVAAGATDDYGSMHDEELAVPMPTMDPNCTRRNHPPDTCTTGPSRNTKKKAIVLGLFIIGVTTAVVPGATLFFSIVVDSFRQEAQTEESFLLNDSGGADDDNCEAATGPWPGLTTTKGDHSVNDDNQNADPGHAYITCFTNSKGGDQCWSKSYYDYWDNWVPCVPSGEGWEAGAPTPHGELASEFAENERYFKAEGYENNLSTCGTACTKFA